MYYICICVCVYVRMYAKWLPSVNKAFFKIIIIIVMMFPPMQGPYDFIVWRDAPTTQVQMREDLIDIIEYICTY